MTTDFHEQRLKMVDSQLRTTDVTSIPVQDAMLKVPREAFVPARRRELAYIDEDILVSGNETSGNARYLMAPSPFGKLLQLTEIRKGDFVLDIGCATGYSAAVLSEIAGSVVALESDPALVEIATATLSSLGCDTVAVVHGPLEEGYASEAPYDVILLNGSVDRIPQALFDQLRDGGRLAAVEGQGLSGVARLYVKEDGIVAPRRGFNAAVNPLPGFREEPAFEF
jgi:protein-L-isoaspartate(D-aspartate) O-methyltransferase